MDRKLISALILTVLLASGTTRRVEASEAAKKVLPRFDVPKVEGIRIDGDAKDWGGRGFRVSVLMGEGGSLKPADDLAAGFRLGWDQRGLLVLVVVSDNVPFESPKDHQLWTHDGIELFLADRHGGEDLVQCIITPGRDPAHPKLRDWSNDMRRSGRLKKTPISFKTASTITANGYVVEALMPWSNLGVKPAMGHELAFQVYVNDSDGSGGKYQAIWFPMAYPHDDRTRMHRIRLSDKPGAPIKAAAGGRYEDFFRRLVVSVIADGELAGKAVTVLHGASTIADGTLSPRGAHAFAKLLAPLPPEGRSYGPLKVLVDRESVADIEVPDLNQVRARQFMDADLIFEPFVFSGSAFPKCRFKQPLVVEQLIGPYTIDVTFHDRNYNVVKQAGKTGRYGAVVKIRAKNGRTYTRYRTVYRQAAPLRWWKPKLAGPGDLPAELGIKPEVVAKQRGHVNEMFKWALADYLNRNRRGAVTLAGLHEMKPEDTEASAYRGSWARDRQWWVSQKRNLNGNARRYADPFVCPRPAAGPPAPVVRDGSLQEAGMKKDAAEKIDAVLTQWAADTDEAFIACVVRRGVIVLHKAYGKRDGRPMTTQTKSWMASLTKLMSGTLVMMLVDQGLIDLDEPIDAYLPELRGIKVKTPLTMRHLYTHTAGMWGHWGEEKDDFEHLIAEYYPYLEVGKQFKYNGMSLELGGKIIEQISGLSVPAFFKKHLLDPLGCRHTDTNDCSGGSMSIALDMAKIGQLLLNKGAYGDKRFMSDETFEKLLPEKLTKVLGPNTKTQRGIGTTWYHHDGLSKRTFGHGAASSATLRIDPGNDLIISMTRNSRGRNFEKYHPKFIRAVVDGIAEK